MRGARGTRAAALLAAAVVGCAPAAFAAGGHHAVDDASILPAGACEQEDWFSRAHGGDRLLHAGLNCRIGPVELGVAGEHTPGAGASATTWNAEVKWARELAQGLSVGFDVQPVWRVPHGARYDATRAVALATWAPGPSVALHLNFGRDLVRASADVARYGLGLDWSPLQRWTFTAERFAQDRTQMLRAGARWEGGRAWKIDLSRAQRLSGPSPSNWTLGLTFAFGE